MRIAPTSLIALLIVVCFVIPSVVALDYFGSLGLAQGADDKEIKKAYKNLARALRPDGVPADQREAARVKFREVTEAYDVLSDPTKRQEYQQSRRRPHSSGEDRQDQRHDLFNQFLGVED